MIGLIAKKIGMSRMFINGNAVAVTILESEPAVVTQIKTKENDGYNAIQVGFVDTKETRITKAQLGHLKKSGSSPKKYLKEFKVSDISGFKLGDKIEMDIFNVGDEIDVVGTSKGKGFAGAMKRHNFAGGPDGHGSMFNRRVGSIGNREWPGRVIKGKKMPGHLGNERVTIKNLKIAYIDKEKNIIAVTGAVPGSRGSYVTLLRKKEKLS
ncbi:MAG: 50S ribosomal protein L3 [Desulfurella sp.]|jgi:large subunit ribosomal protein L3|uniref:Large ribosomal subunit protein uL3 n=1 Tax=Desulfurella multipotens TaxID=79269 RepID=A0A1G6KFQ8_9BACT|nr:MULTISPECIES: 50S ribosomal protein L3 [Desulfurella]AHF96687.1 50S ribosomal protein L3 [Desulfurella acetivorans A63]HEX13988.1 50S ribosomal protein L3 [Desulfurella acetivorans]PMP67910.1 MAG: 50S ribosomal protein L3 [Desulfurella multipotens]PMP87079.1 MAG: 50S ribosomal protein L3 [Desulfurella sp.]SDC29783.1 large subunit ribosomal protein L3 [Desulfurella multipotens]